MNTGTVEQLRRIFSAPRRIDVKQHLRPVQHDFVAISHRIGPPRYWWSRVRAAARELHAVETEGSSAATPAIALVEVFLFLVPIFIAIAAVTFAAYYLSA